MENAVGCIYCGSLGPFTDEHVIPAGLGGDDRNWLLKDCVCGHCNTQIFSKLETKVLRASPIALARLFLQSRTRARGSKTGVPSIQAQVSYYEDEGSKVLLEQELRAGGQPVILPQLLFLPPEVLSLVVADVDTAKAFMATLRVALSDEVYLIEKVREGHEVRYYATRLIWQHDAYVATSREGGSKPPRQGAIWFEPAERPVTTRDGFSLPPRIYQRAAGQLICRARERDHISILLTIVRQNQATVIVPDQAQPKATYAPHLHQRMSVDLQAHDRVLVKIGINLCAYLFGADFVRNTAFDSAREYAKSGKGGVYKVPADKAARFQNAFGPELAHHHVLMLMPGPGKAHDKACVVLLSRFYGGPIGSTRLAQFDGPAPQLTEPVVVVVDYQAQTVSRMSLEAFAAFAVANAYAENAD